MTRDEILAMEPGPELNELVALKVFGQPRPMYVHEPHIEPIWNGHWVCSPDYDEGDVCNWKARDFSGDIAAAWQVVEKMVGSHYCDWTLDMTWYDGPNYTMRFLHADATYEGFGMTAPEAVCKASLLAVEELKCL